MAQARKTEPSRSSQLGPKYLGAHRCPHCGKESLRDQRTGLPTCKCPVGHEWWEPIPGAQTEFLQSLTPEILFGGAAGGSKSTSLLVSATTEIGKGYGTNYKGILLRRTFAELEKHLIPSSQLLYERQFGGRYNKSRKSWTFPGGEKIVFGHIEHDDDIAQYLSSEYQFCGFDELTTFTQAMYIALLTRMRSSIGIPIRLRGATNPGSSGHEWVFKRWAPWLDPQSPTKARPGKVLYFTRDDDGVEHVVDKSHPLALGRTFIPSRLEDNPYLYNDGAYARALQQEDPVRLQQKRYGNWLIKDAKGLFFKREHFHFIDRDELPEDLREIRYWDRAATDPTEAKDPDWTAGVRVGMDDAKENTYIIDVARMRGEPGAVERFIKATAEMDGKDIPIGLEQEPGASGKAEIASYMRLLNGWDVRAYSKRVNKIVAAGPLSAQASPSEELPVSRDGEPAETTRGAAEKQAKLARKGHVYIVRGAWNEPFLAEAEQFPEGSHDDQIDGASGGHTVLAAKKRRVIPVGRSAVRAAINVDDLTG